MGVRRRRKRNRTRREGRGGRGEKIADARTGANALGGSHFNSSLPVEYVADKETKTIKKKLLVPPEDKIRDYLESSVRVGLYPRVPFLPIYRRPRKCLFP